MLAGEHHAPQPGRPWIVPTIWSASKSVGLKTFSGSSPLPHSRSVNVLTVKWRKAYCSSWCQASCRADWAPGHRGPAARPRKASSKAGAESGRKGSRFSWRVSGACHRGIGGGSAGLCGGGLYPARVFQSRLPDRCYATSRGPDGSTALAGNYARRPPGAPPDVAPVYGKELFSHNTRRTLRLERVPWEDRMR